jgi:hypothetical protein
VIPVRIERVVNRKIGTAGLSRTGLLRLLAWIYDELENRAHDHQHNRVPGRPGHFQVRRFVSDGGRTYHFVFAVDERQAGLLRVVACRYGRG